VLSRDGHGLHMKSLPWYLPDCFVAGASRNDGKISVARNGSILNYHTYLYKSEITVLD